MNKRSFRSALIGVVLLVGGIQSGFAQNDQKCSDSAGNFKNTWHSYSESSNIDDTSTCDTSMTLIDDGAAHFRTVWNQGLSFEDDVVGGTGWASGSANRQIGYNIAQFDSNVALKAIAGVYGWSCPAEGPAQEYYVVDSWSGDGQFVPFNTALQADRTFEANGGTYLVYVGEREGPQFCGNGAFQQYWSVRQDNLATGVDREIDFAQHSGAWNNVGFNSASIGNGYQILIGEALGDQTVNHQGVIDAVVWERGQ